MGLLLSESNMKKAFCESLATAGIGAAESHGDDVLAELIIKVVPSEMLNDFPSRLLASATKVCSNDPYNWRVLQREPEFDEETIFQMLLDGWFNEIVWP
ncbi:MAG: hypothetical protein P8184_04735 [Calditrichia bacterium]